jgi:hypothetical protein
MQTPQHMFWLCCLSKVNVLPNSPKHFLRYSKLGFEEPRILLAHVPVAKNVLTELGVGRQRHGVDFFLPDGRIEKCLLFLPEHKKKGCSFFWLFWRRWVRGVAVLVRGQTTSLGWRPIDDFANFANTHVHWHALLI